MRCDGRPYAVGSWDSFRESFVRTGVPVTVRDLSRATCSLVCRNCFPHLEILALVVGCRHPIAQATGLLSIGTDGDLLMLMSIVFSRSCSQRCLSRPYFRATRSNRSFRLVISSCAASM